MNPQDVLEFLQGFALLSGMFVAGAALAVLSIYNSREDPRSTKASFLLVMVLAAIAAVALFLAVLVSVTFSVPFWR